jgi:hypothetical protein
MNPNRHPCFLEGKDKPEKFSDFYNLDVPSKLQIHMRCTMDT